MRVLSGTSISTGFEPVASRSLPYVTVSPPSVVTVFASRSMPVTRVARMISAPVSSLVPSCVWSRVNSGSTQSFFDSAGRA